MNSFYKSSAMALIILMSICSIANAQVDRKTIKQYNTIYSEPEFDSIAKFPGGERALIDFFRINFNSSQHIVNAAKNMDQYFIIDIKIDKTGKIEMVDIFESSLYEANKELRRLCNKMPTWQPAYKNGEAVESWVVLPYAYKIEDRFWEPVYNKSTVYVVENKKGNAVLKSLIITISVAVIFVAGIM